MSQSYDNPFAQNPNAAPNPNAPGAQQGVSGAQHGGPGYPGGGPPQKPKSALPWILGILGVLGLLALLCCGGLVFVGYQAQEKITAFTGEIFKQQYEEGLNADPDFAEHIGEVETMAMDFMASGEFAQENPQQDGPPWLVFNVTGTKGDGTLRIKVDEDGGDQPTAEAILVLEDGSEFPMTIPVNQDVDFEGFGGDSAFEIDVDTSDDGGFSVDVGTPGEPEFPIEGDLQPSTAPSP